MRSSTPIFVELLGGPLAQAVAEVGQRLLAPIDEDDTHGGRLNVAEVARQAPDGQLADLAGQLHAGGPGADDGERHEEALLVGVRERLGDLEGPVDAAADVGRFFDGLQPRRDRAPIRRGRSTTFRAPAATISEL